MGKRLGHVAAVVALLGLMEQCVVAQQRAHPAVKTPTGATVAVVDIARVFKSHVLFSRQMEALKQEIQAFEAEVNRRRRALLDRSLQLEQDYKAGTPEYQQLEAAIAREQAQLLAQMRLKRNEILDRESRLYGETYQDIVGAVSRIADQLGVDLVLRYDSDVVEPQDRAKVVKALNRMVVMQHQLDLTNLVLQQVNSAQASRRLEQQRRLPLR